MWMPTINLCSNSTGSGELKASDLRKALKFLAVPPNFVGKSVPEISAGLRTPGTPALRAASQSLSGQGVSLQE
jgi:hypothetical protein